MRRLIILAAVFISPVAQLMAQKPITSGAADCNGNAKPELVLQTGHAGPVTSVAVSPDGRWLASGSEDHTIRIWEAATGRELRTLLGHGIVTSVAFSPNGRWIASGFDVKDKVRFWEIATGREVRSLDQDNVKAVAFSADGRWFASGGDELTLWNLDTGGETRTLLGDSGEGVSALAFSPDGRELASGSTDGNIKFYDLVTGRLLRTLPNRGAIASVSFSPDGHRLAAGGSLGIILFEVSSGRELPTQADHVGWINSVSFSPDGRLLVSGSTRDHTVKLWDATTGHELRTLVGHSSEVNSVVFSPNGQWVASGGEDATVRIWQPATGNELRTMSSHGSRINSVAFSPDNRWIASSGSDSVIELWNLYSGSERGLMGHSDGVNAVAFSPNARWLASASTDHTLKLWDVESGREVRTLSGHRDAVSSVMFSPDGRWLATGSWDRSVRIWEPVSGRELRTLSGHTDKVNAVAFSPDGRLLASASADDTVKIWDVVTGRELQTLVGGIFGVYSVAFSPDGRSLAAGGMEGPPKLWDVATGREVRTLSGLSGKVSVDALAFSPDGRKLAAGSAAENIEIWDVATGQSVRTLSGHNNTVRSATFSADGKWLVSGSSDGSMRLWDVANGRELVKAVPLGKQDWAVVDPQGRFDASGAGMEMMRWAVGQQIIALEQLKERYYEPGLLAKILGRSKEALRDVTGFDHVALFPQLSIAAPVDDSGKLKLGLKDCGGGIGRVQLFVNGKEYLVLDSKQAATQSQTGPITVDLAGAPTVAPGEPNEVRVVVWNRENYLWGSSEPLRWTPPGVPDRRPPELHAIFVGISHYASKDSSLDLQFSAKDAANMARAFEIAGKRFFGPDNVHITLLTSPTEKGMLPTKENIRRAFEGVRKMRRKDLLIVYFAGHGVTVHDMYGFPTQEASSLDLSDEARRANEAITDEELVDWIKKVPARHQVLILDTCAAGRAEARLNGVRDVPGDQVRAAERFKDRTGFYVLMGSAADAASYEASMYDEGLLTYALLQGMLGAALRDDKYVDVSQLFQYAANTVPELAHNIGGIQQPHIATPYGIASFDIGELLLADRANIPIAEPKPMILRASFQSQDRLLDYLKLTAAFRQSLREASVTTSRGGKWIESPAVFIDADDMPRAILPTGRYTVDGNIVSVQLSLSRDQKQFTQLKVEGAADDISGLAAKIVDAVLRAASENR